MAVGFHVGAVDGSGGLLDGCAEAEAAIDDGDVVGDGFGDCADRDGDLALSNLLVEKVAGLQAAIPADDVQLVDALLHHLIDDSRDIRHTPAKPEHTASIMVYRIHRLNIQFLILLIEEPFERILDPVDNGHPVVLLQAHHKLFDQSIDSWGQATASDDSCADVGRMEEAGGPNPGDKPLFGVEQHLPGEDAGVVQDERAGQDNALGGKVAFVSVFFRFVLDQGIGDSLDIFELVVDYDVWNLFELCCQL